MQRGLRPKFQNDTDMVDMFLQTNSNGLVTWFTFDDDHKDNGSDDVYNDVDAPIRDKIRPKQVSSKAPIGWSYNALLSV